MNVLFIFSTYDYLSRSRPLLGQIDIQLGLSHISSLLKCQGHRTELLVLTRGTPFFIIDKYLQSFKPGLVCFTAVASEYDFICKAAQRVRDRFPRIYLLAGGPHVTLNPRLAIEGPFDAVCVGEGEYPVLELVTRLEKGEKITKIENLWIKRGDVIEKNPPRKFLQDIDSLPFPDRKIWQKWIAFPNSRHTILLGRGCPFQCTYCCNHALSRVAPGKYVRLRSPENVKAELTALVEEFPDMGRVYFEIETIGANIDYAVELAGSLERFNRRCKVLKYSVNLRVTPRLDGNRLFQALRKANFESVNIGLESGSRKIRENVLNRHYDNSDIVEAVRLAKRYGLKVALYVMLGLPGESLRDFRETVRCCRSCLPDRINLSVFFPYPGTILHRCCQQHGLLPSGIDSCPERRKPVLRLPGFSGREIQKEFTWFHYHVYKGHWPFLLLLGYAAVNKMLSNPTSFDLARKFADNKTLVKLTEKIIGDQL